MAPPRIFGTAATVSAGLNLALFGPQALVSRNPLMLQPWLYETRTNRVSFSAGTRVVSFEATTFQIDGELPLPAS